MVNLTFPGSWKEEVKAAAEGNPPQLGLTVLMCFIRDVSSVFVSKLMIFGTF